MAHRTLGRSQSRAPPGRRECWRCRAPPRRGTRARRRVVSMAMALSLVLADERTVGSGRCNHVTQPPLGCVAPYGLDLGVRVHVVGVVAAVGAVGVGRVGQGVRRQQLGVLAQPEPRWSWPSTRTAAGVTTTPLLYMAPCQMPQSSAQRTVKEPELLRSWCRPRCCSRGWRRPSPRAGRPRNCGSRRAR